MEIYLWFLYEDFYIAYSLKLFLKDHVLNQKSQFNLDLTNNGQNAYF